MQFCEAAPKAFLIYGIALIESVGAGYHIAHRECWEDKIGGIECIVSVRYTSSRSTKRSTPVCSPRRSTFRQVGLPSRITLR